MAPLRCSHRGQLCRQYVCKVFEPAKSEVIGNQQPLYGAAERAFPKSANVRRDFLAPSFKGKHRHSSPHTTRPHPSTNTFAPRATNISRSPHTLVCHQRTALPRPRLATQLKNAQTEIPETAQKGLVSRPQRRKRVKRHSTELRITRQQV